MMRTLRLPQDEGFPLTMVEVLHSRNQQGTVGLLTVIGGLVFSAMAVMLIAAAAGTGVAAARARAAADAAALAAMGVSPVISSMSEPGSKAGIGHELAEREAERVASANGARLVEMDVTGWPLRVRVTVKVLPRQKLGGLPIPSLRAHATAAARPSDQGS